MLLVRAQQSPVDTVTEICGATYCLDETDDGKKLLPDFREFRETSHEIRAAKGGVEGLLLRRLGRGLLDGLV